MRRKACGKTTTAPFPPLPCERVKFTCAFLAWVVMMKFALLVPLDRIRRLLLSQGIDIPEPTLVRLIELASDLAGPVDGDHWKQIKATPCILADATGLKVLVPGIEKTWDAYLDVFNADKIAVYQVTMTKHGDDLAALFHGFRGIVMCDAESRMNDIFRTEGILRANCNAHPRRNPSERAFQNHAKLRLNALFAGSPEGGRRWAVLLGIVTTAKCHGLDVQTYLTWMFERRGTWRKRYGLTAAEVTPAAYKQVIERPDSSGGRSRAETWSVARYGAAAVAAPFARIFNAFSSSQSAPGSTQKVL